MKSVRKSFVCSVFVLALSDLALGAAMNIYVSPGGSDANPGTASKPVASLAAAQHLVRKFSGREPVHVWLHGGTYYLPETLVFAPADGGSERAPVIWQAVKGETPVISGGQPLAHLHWELSKETSAAGVYQCRVPAGLDIDQLFVDGKQQWMARFPNRKDGDDLNVFDTWELEDNSKPDPMMDPLSPQRIARWHDPAGAYLHAMHPALWGGIDWLVTGKREDGTLALVGGTQNNRGSGVHPLYRYVENVFEELDAPHEWFHNGKTNQLYYFPPAGMDLAKASIVIVSAHRRQLIKLQGSQANPVKWLDFRGITFRHTARTFMETKEPLLRSDWTIYRGGAVLLTGTENCQLEDCDFDQVGGNAIFVSDYNRRATLRGCLITDAGANGICFVGDPVAVRNALFNYDQRLKPSDLDRVPGPKSDNYPADCLADDCLITHTGRFEKQSSGVDIDIAKNITVRHCSIYDVPRSGINIGDGCWGGNIIEFCDVFDTVKETGDHGSFNSWGRDRYWPGEIFNLNDDDSWASNRDLPFLDATQPNILRNNRWRCDHGWDIDLDDGSTNYEICDNLCLNGGIKNREGFHRVVENNVILNSGFHPHVWYKHSGDIFRRNIVSAAHYLPALMGPPPWGGEMDYNLVNVTGMPDIEPAAEMASQSGRDKHSIIADAEFIDPAHGDFRVRAGSPAFKLGFVNFPMDRFGVQKPSLKALVRTPSFSIPGGGPAAKISTGIKQWMGDRVKDLETIEEASSVGVGLGTGGVMVLEAPSNSLATKFGLRRGDLIVSVDGKPVKTTTDLPKTSSLAVRMEVVRDQRRQSLKP